MVSPKLGGVQWGPVGVPLASRGAAGWPQSELLYATEDRGHGREGWSPSPFTARRSRGDQTGPVAHLGLGLRGKPIPGPTVEGWETEPLKEDTAFLLWPLTSSV